MGKQEKQRSVTKEHRVSPLVLVFLITAFVILTYGLFANTVFVQSVRRCMNAAYKEIVQMDLLRLDTEDIEILQSFQTERLEFLITDQDFNLIYSTNNINTDGQIERYIKAKRDLYQEKNRISYRRYENMQIIRFRAMIEQEGEPFYLYIRREIRDVRQVISNTFIYLAAVWLLLCAAAYFLTRQKERKAPLVREPLRSPLDEAQKEFVANISHELKTPLAVISGQVEMLQSMGDEIDRDYYFASIREEIDKMSGMVGNLLDLTIMEHRMEEMEMSTVNLTDLMEYMALKYDALFQKNQIKVSCEVEQGCLVTGNRMYLEQAVNNYIMNAFQHTAQGKKIRISLQVRDMARIAIYNEGDPIPPEDMDLIWQGFYKNAHGKREKSVKLSNAGLGLYMVKKIVDQHRGECGVENLERGVEFWIRLPLQ